MFDKEMIDTLLDLRDFLSCAIDNICSKKTIDLEDINKINEYLKVYSFYKVLKKEKDRFYLKTIPVNPDLNLIIFEITSSFVEMITKHEVERIKLCENPECKWVFYDESRNHTRKWCDNTCATLIKVRRFRENKKHGEMKKKL
jgi:predicted RNA-binding Zn ribbon-like protein